MKVNQTKFAEIIGKSSQYVALLIEQGMPAERAGKRGAAVFVDTAKAIAWLLASERRKVEAEHAPVSTTESETRRLRAAQADLTELEAAEKRGELVPAEDVQIMTNEMCLITRRECEAVASRAPRCSSARVRPKCARSCLPTYGVGLGSRPLESSNGPPASAR